MARFLSIRHLALGSLLAGSIALGGAIAAMAQDAEAPDSHPSHIHVGTCAELDPNPAAPLNNIIPIGVDPDDEAAEVPDALGVLTVSPILYADSEDVEMTWDEMLETSHAINVHESDENVQNYIACGDIGGVVVDDGSKLVIALHPQNDSGYSGTAILQKDDEDNVDVEIYLTGPPVEDVETTPEATPMT